MSTNDTFIKKNWDLLKDKLQVDLDGQIEPEVRIDPKDPAYDMSFLELYRRDFWAGVMQAKEAAIKIAIEEAGYSIDVAYEGRVTIVEYIHRPGIRELYVDAELITWWDENNYKLDYRDGKLIYTYNG